MLRSFPKPIRRAFKDVLIVRLFRLWVKAREDGANPALALQAEVKRQGSAGFTGAACGCLFELIEAQLNRRMVRPSMSDPRYAEDERHLLNILWSERYSLSPQGRDGLSDATDWAVAAVRSGMHVEPGARNLDRTYIEATPILLG